MRVTPPLGARGPAYGGEYYTPTLRLARLSATHKRAQRRRFGHCASFVGRFAPRHEYTSGLPHLPPLTQLAVDSRGGQEGCVAEEPLGRMNGHADHGSLLGEESAPRGLRPPYLITVPGQSDTRPSGEGEWCWLPMLGPRAPRQRYAISAYVIYRYVSIYRI